VLGSRVLRKIFGPKREDVTGNLRKLHDGERHDLYCASNVTVIR
jgi:hypothetical protein